MIAAHPGRLAALAAAAALAGVGCSLVQATPAQPAAAPAVTAQLVRAANA